jgi:hypothetical protein
MRWWPEADPRYPEWRQGGIRDRSSLPENVDLDAGYVDCLSCKTAYVAVIRFVDCRPVAVEQFQFVEKWPEGFWR